MERSLVALLSDSHGGHRLGLLNPATVLTSDEGEPYHRKLGTTQEYLWDKYTGYIGRAVELAHGDRIIPLHHGDLCHGLKYPDQLINLGMADQLAISVANLMPWVELPNVSQIRLVSGTPAHEFSERGATKLTDMLMKAMGIDVAFVSHGLLTVDGVEFDVAHRGATAGIRDWTRGNVLRLYARSIVNRSIKELDQAPPRIISRGHVHQFAHETVRDWHKGQRTETDVLIVPPLCGLGEHGRGATQSEFILTTGLLAIEIVDGDVRHIHEWVDRLDLRTEEEL